ncbi:MAG: beta-lactamase family protein [Acidobacteria bacterium]|nr:beta-lactamase family protein [Acidobacteriota bacterium]
MPGRHPDTTFPLTRSVIEAAVVARAFPAAAIEVGSADGPLWTEAFGALRYDDRAPATAPDTIFDLASLTKVIATTSIAMQLVKAGAIDLDHPVGAYLRGWDEGSRGAVRVRHLLDHSSGLPAHARLWEQGRGRADYEDSVRQLPVEAAPGTRAVYSDIGFMLLGFIIEDAGGEPLDARARTLASELALGDICYLPPADWLPRTAPTEFDPWRSRLLVGEVHDENAGALGGVAAHAGLFGTAPAVGRFARAVLHALGGGGTSGTALPLMRQFAEKTGVPGSSRALGWDTMLTTSSCGTRLSPSAIGHTGFTGTSLWIDPEKDLYVVLLTNRVHPTRSNEAIRPIRPRVHDAVIEDLERTGELGLR